MFRYAQTNLQLYNQLRAAGATEQVLAETARAYELARELFAGSFRPNGKPFLCHLVGTASVLASWPASHHEVLCGLLHAVYAHGQFGDQRRGITPAKRNRVRQTIGSEVEQLVFEYAQLPWKAPEIRELAARIETLPALARTLVRVRLANELEDHLDLAMQYCGKTTGEALGPVRAELLTLARRLVGPDFAAELEAEFAANERGDVPAVLRRTDRRSFHSPLKAPHWLARLKGLLRRGA